MRPIYVHGRNTDAIFLKNDQNPDVFFSVDAWLTLLLMKTFMPLVFFVFRLFLDLDFDLPFFLRAILLLFHCDFGGEVALIIDSKFREYSGGIVLWLFTIVR
jgi:hypothetical protein